MTPAASQRMMKMGAAWGGSQSWLQPAFSRPSAGHEGSLMAQEPPRSEEHTSELQSLTNLVCRLLLEKKQDVQAIVEKLEIIPTLKSDGLEAIDLPRVIIRRPEFALFFNVPATTEPYSLTPHRALPV